MSILGFSCNPSRLLPMKTQGRCTIHGQASAFPVDNNREVFFRSLRQPTKNMEFMRSNISYMTGKYMMGKTHNKIKSAVDASFGDMTGDSTEIYPRINIRDPYKRLGISKEATEEEVVAARNYLIKRYAGHKASVDAIESAQDEIIMLKYHERIRPKPDIRKKVRAFTQSPILQTFMNRFRTPSTKFMMMTAALFAILGVLTVLYPTEDGPTFQVAVSLVATLCFIYNRLKSKIRTLLYGIGAFGISWLLGTFLMVSVIPPVLRGPRSLEVATSLISYVFLWFFSTYLT